MEFLDSDYENEWDEGQSPSPSPPDILCWKNTLNSSQYACVCMNIRLDVRDLTRRIERYHFEDELAEDNYIADLNALFEGRVVSASTKTEEGVFKTVKGRKKGRSPTPPDASKSQNVRSVNNEQMTPLKSLKTMKTRMTPESIPKSTTLFALHLQ
ncbi:hypothetical protein TNCV_3694741 [Trichonephila clavipes]|nr:hypothetical protein TNCV_3694741 [Trichonephila clavipes]